MISTAKKVARRIHPILGTPIQALKNLVSPTKRDAPPVALHSLRRPKPDIFHAAGYGDPNAKRPDPKQCVLERRAREKKEAEEGRAFRRTNATRPIPGTFTYGPGSFSEMVPKSKQIPNRLPPQPGPSKLRAAGSFKRNKSLAGTAARQQTQKLRSVGNLARQDASRDLAKEMSMNLSRLSLNLEELPPQPHASLDSVEARFSEIINAGGLLTKQQELLLKEAKRMKESEEQSEIFDERCAHKAKAEKVRRKNNHQSEAERPPKRVRIREQLVEPREPREDGLTDPGEDETPRPGNRYGLRAQNSSFTVYEKVEGGYKRNDEATRAAKERKEEELKQLQEEEERRAEEEKRVKEEKARHDPFQTETRKPSGRRVASTGGYHTRARPRPPPLPTPKQLVADKSQHTEFLQRAKQAEENDQRVKEEARRRKEFRERVRLQEEEEARQERRKREQLEQRRLNEQYQRDMAELRQAKAEPSNLMNVDGPPALPTIEDRLDDYEKRWDILTQKGARNLRFSDIPWPVLCDTRDLSALTPANIEPFVAHSLRRVASENTLKHLIKSDLLMWHPDRFTKYRKRVIQQHWPMVQDGVNIVAQVLINMKKDLTRFA